MNVPVTSISKIFILKLFMTSHRTTISVLKFNKSKTFSRSALMINSLFKLIQSSLSLSTQLFNSLNNIFSSEFSANKRRLSILRRLIFDKMFNIERSENSYFFRFSQFFVIRLRASIKSIINLKTIYDNEKKREKREKKRRQEKIIVEIQNN